MRLATRLLMLAGAVAISAALAATGGGSQSATSAPSIQAASAPQSQILAMRRITEAQYRSSIADIFGPDIRIAGRFEPIVRPVHEMIASGAREASISPSGLEQFDAMARQIAGQVFDAAHRSQFAACQPADAQQADASCVAQVLAPLGRLLYRRPLSPGEQAFYVKLASQAAGATGSFDKGLELALAAMLVSPNFLYIVERGEADPASPGASRLDNYTRAARLSYMLWNTTPNEALLQAADQGKLTDPVALSAIASRMVNSPRFEQGVRAFFADMLLFEKFDELAKDPVIYPYFNQDVARALPEQTLRTIAGHLLTRSGDYRELFVTPHSYMSRALGPLYRVPVRHPQGWEPYTFAPGDDRAGLLGQAGLLAMYSHSGRSSPTLRGRAIRELLMCQAVPNPPGNVNFTAVQDVTNKAMPTARIRLTAHNTDEVCAGCHKITDPPGLSLERFDGIGAVRTSENDAPIDASGVIDGKLFDGALGLGKTLAASPDTTQCVSARALQYATGLGSEAVAPWIEALDKQFAASGYGIRALFLKVATMPETWAVPAAPGQSGTHVSLIRRR
jgi:Protein of unknown function (DUF1588)/Protein of unknown function (DUF1592)/Protein of unknown function (DUF1595)/Protein of unknown function (DUF1585)/Protein of unknown function (DUF1587)